MGLFGRIRRRRDADPVDVDQGFTLIELLMVVMIIGILAGLAMAVFLNQRHKGYDAAAKSDIKNMADFEEIYLNDYNTYGTLLQVKTFEPDVNASHGVTLSVDVFNGQYGYCLSAHHVSSSNTFYYDSQAGGLQPTGSTGCPVTTTGLPGGSMTGN